jgi:hypothetical protein
MDAEIKNVELFLEKNSRNAIDLKNFITKEGILSKVNLAYIKENHDDIEKFFIYLKLNYKIDTVQIIKYTPNGSSFKQKDGEIELILGVKNKPLEGDASQGATANPVNAPSAANFNNQNMNPQPSNYNSHAQGLNAVEIAKGIIAENKVETLNEKVLDLKEALKKQEKKTDRKEDLIEDLVKQLRDAKSELANYQQKMDLEILKIQIDKQPALSPELAQILADKGLTVLSDMLNRGKGAITQMATGLGGDHSSLSALKQGIINFMSQDTFTEVHAALFDKIILGVTENQQYVTELDLLNIKYNII